MSSSVPAVVVLNFGASELLASYLATTVGQEHAVWLVDNPSTPEERGLVKEMARQHGWNLLTPRRNGGFGAGINEGVRAAVAAGATEVAVLNPDLRLTPSALTSLLAAARAQPTTVIAPTVLRPDGSVYSRGHELVWSSGIMRAAGRSAASLPEEHVAPWITGAAWAFSVQVWDAVGPLAEDFFLYWEDVEWCLRAQRRGMTLQVLSDVVAVHDDGGTQVGDRPAGYGKSVAYVYYSARNRLLFARRYLGTRDRWRWWVGTPRAVWIVLGHGGRRSLLRTIAPWKAAVAGVWDGFCGKTGQRQVSASGDASGPVRVVQSFPPPRPTTNPYIVMLHRALGATDRVQSCPFSWRVALWGQYDVVHAHWPENLIQGTSRVKTVAKCILFVMWTVRITLRKVPVVRTVHNLYLPSGLGRVRKLLLRTFDLLTAREIHLNPCTPSDRPHDVIAHGDYRNWFARYPRSAPVPGRLAFVGLVRRYKGVPELLAAWQGVRGEVSLSITGKVSSRDLLTELEAAADARVVFDARYVDDALWVERVTQAVCVILPYRHMHNSGTVLAVLSLGRPVVVPRSDVTDLLAAEVGEEWVFRYDGELTAGVLEAAITQGTAVIGTGGEPNLAGRTWVSTGEDHWRTYQRARGVAVVSPDALRKNGAAS